MNYPQLGTGTCVATGDEFWAIMYDSGDTECYHCGGDIKEVTAL